MSSQEPLSPSQSEALREELQRIREEQAEHRKMLSRLLEETDPDPPVPADPQNPPVVPPSSPPIEPPSAPPSPGSPIVLAPREPPTETEEDEALARMQAEQGELQRAAADQRAAENARTKKLAGRWL